MKSMLKGLWATGFILLLTLPAAAEIADGVDEGNVHPCSGASPGPPNYHSLRWAGLYCNSTGIQSGGGASWWRKAPGTTNSMVTSGDPLAAATSHTVEFRFKLPGWTDPYGGANFPIAVAQQGGSSTWSLNIGRQGWSGCCDFAYRLSGPGEENRTGDWLTHPWGDDWHVIRVIADVSDTTAGPGGTISLYADGDFLNSILLLAGSAPGGLLWGNGSNGTNEVYVDYIRWADAVVPIEEPLLVEAPADCAAVIALGLGLEGDLLPDCAINLLDFAEVAANWMECNDPARLDECTKNW